MGGAMGNLQMARRWESAADLPDMSKCFRERAAARQAVPWLLCMGVFSIFWLGASQLKLSCAAGGRSSLLISLRILRARSFMRGDRCDNARGRRITKTWTQVCAGSKFLPADRCFIVGHAPPSKPANVSAAPNEMLHDVHDALEKPSIRAHRDSAARRRRDGATLRTAYLRKPSRDARDT